MLALGVDSFSIIFNHPSFQKPDPFPLVVSWFPEKIRIPGFRMDMEATLRVASSFPSRSVPIRRN